MRAALGAALGGVLAAGLNNGVGALPFMGFTTWDAFGCRPSMNETSVRSMIDAIVHTGLRDLGYVRVNLDDCWQQRAPNGTIVSDPTRFPSGIPALASYAHASGLLFGVYTDVGNTTCAGHPGSYGYEGVDAAAYAAWGVDFLKEDHCNLPNPLPDGMDEDAFYNYALALMRDSLNATGRRIFFDLCAHSCYAGQDLHSAECWAQWYANATGLGNSRRTTTDAAHTWPSVIENWYRNDAFGNGSFSLAQFNGPFSWNDPDALQIGNLPASVTAAQQRMHFSAWCIMASPLIFGTELTPAALAILSNADAIAVDQDPLGVQGVRVHVAGEPIYSLDEYKNGLVHWPQEVWAKPLASGERAVLVVNHNATAPAEVAINLADIAKVYPPLLASPVGVYDLWSHTAVANVTGAGWVVTIPPLDSFFFRLTGSKASALTPGAGY